MQWNVSPRLALLAPWDLDSTILHFCIRVTKEFKTLIIGVTHTKVCFFGKSRQNRSSAVSKTDFINTQSGKLLTVQLGSTLCMSYSNLKTFQGGFYKTSGIQLNLCFCSWYQTLMYYRFFILITLKNKNFRTCDF